MMNSRFVNSSLPRFSETNSNSIFDYENIPLLALEDTVRNITQLLPDVADYTLTAKKKCNRDSPLLTHEESAAIYLYSMPTPFFYHLNIALRPEGRHMLKPWIAYLKLFITALKKLPSTKAVIWRGVKYDATLAFVENEVYTWWDINSCTTKYQCIAQKFLGERWHIVHN